MRTDAPPQHEEPTAACTTIWGLGPRNANDRWNICDQYIKKSDCRGTRDGLHSAPIQAGCPDNIAEMVIETWLQAGLLIHSGEHIRAGAADVQGNLRILEPPERQEEHFPSGTHLVALLPLLDGTGLARIAIEEATNDCEGIVLVRSAFVEHDRTLARQVATVWGYVMRSITAAPRVPTHM